MDQRLYVDTEDMLRKRADSTYSLLVVEEGEVAVRDAADAEAAEVVENHRAAAAASSSAAAFFLGGGEEERRRGRRGKKKKGGGGEGTHMKTARAFLPPPLRKHPPTPPLLSLFFFFLRPPLVYFPICLCSLPPSPLPFFFPRPSRELKEEVGGSVGWAHHASLFAASAAVDTARAEREERRKRGRNKGLDSKQVKQKTYGNCWG